MKRLRLCSSLALAALLIGLAFAPLVSAQEQRPSNFPRMQGSMQPPPPEQVAQVYAEKLGLREEPE